MAGERIDRIVGKPTPRRPVTVEERPNTVQVGTKLNDGSDEYICEDRGRRGGGHMEWVKLRNPKFHAEGEGVWFRLEDAGPLFLSGVFTTLPPQRRA